MLLRHAQRHGAGRDLEPVRCAIDALIDRYRQSRLLDDARFAEALARGLRERGASTARIRLKLRQRGIAEETSETVLRRLETHGEDPDLAAARAYARRRRLRARYDLDDAAQRQKALAALARQGFSFAVARAALEPEDDQF